jgi:phosphoribosylaminoimidazole carboxylase PurE protein
MNREIGPDELESGRSETGARLAVLLGSSSDLPVIEDVGPLCERFGIGLRVEVASAHRQPERLHQVVQQCEANGVQVFMAVAGMAAHLPGVVASLTLRPVIGVPVAVGSLGGLDALLSIVQMPPGVPVATVSIGKAGARNAVILAARILALSDPSVAAALAAYRDSLAQGGR